MAIPTAERPSMPNYGIVKSKKGLMSWDWVEQQLTKSRNYWICTTREDGRPHAAPVWGTWVDGALYFGTDPGSVKGRNLARSPEVVVHLESGDDVVILEGVIEVVKDVEATLAERIADSYGEKYKGFRPEDINGLYCLKPSQAFSWLESSFGNSATRWSFGS